MRRRRYLSLAGLAAVGLAGCSGDSEGSGDGSDGGDTATDADGDATTATATATATETPTATVTDTATEVPTTTAVDADMGPAEVVETFLTAAGDGDIERANALVHSDSPQGEIEASDQREDIVVESTEVLSQDDGVAVVRTEVTVVTQDGEQTYTVEYELRTENGAWRMWDAADGGGSDVQPPQVAWEFENVPSDDVVVVTHTGGDTVDPTTVVAKNLEGTTFGSFDEFFDGTEMAAGDEVRIDVPADTRGTIQLVWRDPDSDASRVIGEADYDVR